MSAPCKATHLTGGYNVVLDRVVDVQLDGKTIKVEVVATNNSSIKSSKHMIIQQMQQAS